MESWRDGGGIEGVMRESRVLLALWVRWASVVEGWGLEVDVVDGEGYSGRM